MNWVRIEAVLDDALDIDPEKRAALVRERLGDAPSLEREALSLLAAMEESGEFLSLETACPPRPGASQGARFGPWKVCGIMGAGGMGEVFRVERADGEYQQFAALKLMRALPAAYLSRFHVERQILASLDHPGIAHLIDGGVTKDGRPYMVMDFVEGEPIDVWCRERRIEPVRRVELIIQVCEAISHAHAKLVVHRDIKPSNILVTADGRTRLIDFGVARTMTVPTSAQTETPISVEYAAPELLEGTQATVMTDVYGVAATLFELLAGRVPVDVTGLPVAVAVMRIAETPADRLLATMQRHLLSNALATDLDAVLVKALRKEPHERYLTVEAFASDLRRALEGHPVKARDEERSYAARRFIRRRWWPLAAAAAVAISLSAGLGAALLEAERADRQRDAAVLEQSRLAAVQQYLYFLLRDAAEMGGPEADVSQILDRAAAEVLDQFESDPVRGGPVIRTLGELFFYMNDYDAAEPLLMRLIDVPGVDAQLTAAAAYDLAQIKLRRSDQESAANYLARAQVFWSADPVRWRSELIDSRLVEARLLRDRGQVELAVQLLQDNIAERVAISGPHHREAGVYYNDLGAMLAAAGRLEDAIPAFRSALEVWRVGSLELGPDALNTLNNLAAMEVLSGRPDAAEPIFRQAVQVRRRLYGPSGATAALLNNHGKTLLQLSRAPEAVELLEEAAAMARSHVGTGSLHYASAMAGLSEAYLVLGDTQRASVISETGLDEVSSQLGPRHSASAIIAVSLGRVRAAQGRTEEAHQLLDDAEDALSVLGASAASQKRAIQQIRTVYGLSPGRGN